jgi:DNA-binding MarR family transcriptional regulator
LTSQILIKYRLMNSINTSAQFFIHLTKAQAAMSRHFDARIGGGLSLNDFIILYHLSQAEDEKLRRIDLAQKVGLTASGITRLLAPMEKVGLIKRETNTEDARVSYVALASGGKRILSERLEKVELLAEEAKQDIPVATLKEFSAALIKIAAVSIQ